MQITTNFASSQQCTIRLLMMVDGLTSIKISESVLVIIPIGMYGVTCYNFQDHFIHE